MAYYIYILLCADNSYYVGSSEDVAERVRAHNQGAGAEYTKNRRPVTMVYSEAFTSRNAAIQRERQLKKWSHAKKEALIIGDLAKLKALSKSRLR